MIDSSFNDMCINVSADEQNEMIQKKVNLPMDKCMHIASPNKEQCPEDAISNTVSQRV